MKYIFSPCTSKILHFFFIKMKNIFKFLKMIIINLCMN